MAARRQAGRMAPDAGRVQPRRRPGPGRAAHRDDAVTPVIGAILVLAITVVGIAAVMVWGAPTIERIQGRNSLLQVANQLEDLRDAQRDLSIPDHSRFPSVDLPGGTLALEPGTRYMLTIDQDTGTTSCSGGSCALCDFHVTNWADTSAKTQVSVSSSGCRTPTTSCSPVAAGSACLEVFSVSGSSTAQQTVTWASPVATVAGADFSTGDWLFRLSDGNTLTPTVYAQAWLLTSDRIDWSQSGASGTRQAILDGGAVYTQESGSLFLQKSPVIEDTALGTGYYGIWLRTMSAGSYSSFVGQGTYQVYFALMSNSVRADTTAAYRLRYDTAQVPCAGTNCQANTAAGWCNSMVARDQLYLVGSTSQYTSDSVMGCSTPDSAGERSVCFARTAALPAPTNACAVSGFTPAAFQMRFIHARIYTGLAV